VFTMMLQIFQTTPPAKAPDLKAKTEEHSEII
jgi:hypothetical protein